MRALRACLDRARRLLASLLCCQDTTLNSPTLGALSSPMSDPHPGNRWGQSNNFRTFCPGRFIGGARRDGGRVDSASRTAASITSPAAGYLTADTLLPAAGLALQGHLGLTVTTSLEIDAASRAFGSYAVKFSCRFSDASQQPLQPVTTQPARKVVLGALHTQLPPDAFLGRKATSSSTTHEPPGTSPDYLQQENKIYEDEDDELQLEDNDDEELQDITTKVGASGLRDETVPSRRGWNGRQRRCAASTSSRASRDGLCCATL